MSIARGEVTGRHLVTSEPADTGVVTDPLALLTKQQLAELLKVDAWTIDRWRKRKSDPDFPEPIWISGTTPRWRRVDIERWLATRQRGGVSPDWTQSTTTRRRRRRTQAANNA
jgi:predicted DNA-binding transcriptional regulator AlpA